MTINFTQSVNYYIPEIFEKVGHANGLIQRSEVLRKYDSETLRFYLKLLFDKPDILVKQVPPYRESTYPMGLGFTDLHKSRKRVEMILTGSGLDERKSSQIITNVLESVSKEEAELLCMVIRGKPEYKGLTRKMVERAFPDLLQPVSENTKKKS